MTTVRFGFLHDWAYLYQENRRETTTLTFAICDHERQSWPQTSIPSVTLRKSKLGFIKSDERETGGDDFKNSSQSRSRVRFRVDSSFASRFIYMRSLTRMQMRGSRTESCVDGNLWRRIRSYRPWKVCKPNSLILAPSLICSGPSWLRLLNWAWWWWWVVVLRGGDEGWWWGVGMRAVSRGGVDPAFIPYFR